MGRLRVLAVFAAEDAHARDEIFDEAFTPFIERHFSAYRGHLIALGQKNAPFRQWLNDLSQPFPGDATEWAAFIEELAAVRARAIDSRLRFSGCGTDTLVCPPPGRTSGERQALDAATKLIPRQASVLGGATKLTSAASTALDAATKLTSAASTALNAATRFTSAASTALGAATRLTSAVSICAWRCNQIGCRGEHPCLAPQPDSLPRQASVLDAASKLASSVSTALAVEIKLTPAVSIRA